MNDAEKRLFMWLDEKGYQPPLGKAGGLEDLSSLDRIMTVLQTNRDMARGHANWVASQAAIRIYPCQRLYRLEQRMEPRDWPRIWADAKAELADIPGVHPTEMVALLNHPIWVRISRFKQPYPPFDFGSGMDVDAVGRDEAIAMGFSLDPNNDPMQQPLFRSMNEGLEVSPKVKEEILLMTLSDRLGRFGDMVDGELVFTDPDGTRKFTAAKLAEIWARPAPEGYDILTQKDALDQWDGGATPDKTAERIALRRLFDRIENEEAAPSSLFRGFTLSAADAVALIRGLEAKRLMVPANVAGWEWVDDIAKAVLPPPKAGWRVILQMVGGSKRVVDIRALRPGKPGYVTVGGIEFEISDFAQDVESRTIRIILQ